MNYCANPACGKSLYNLPLGHYRAGTRDFCSPQCADAYNRKPVRRVTITKDAPRELARMWRGTMDDPMPSMRAVVYALAASAVLVALAVAAMLVLHVV